MFKKRRHLQHSVINVYVLPYLFYSRVTKAYAVSFQVLIKHVYNADRLPEFSVCMFVMMLFFSIFELV